ncbi:MAG: hypothetical protein JXR76_28720 [Deltaproteobacteria bacterium]|nr:hypothetical protein [Deltaproteobacteria bacterium]
MKKDILQLALTLLAALLSMQACKSDGSKSSDSGDDTTQSSDKIASSDNDDDSATAADGDTDTDTDTDADGDGDSDTNPGRSTDSDSNIPTAECPDALPTDGDACENMQLRGCAFGDVTCDCAWGGGGGGFAWSCKTSCPAAAPADGDACSETQYTPCAFEPDTCVCKTTDDSTWTWSCEEVATECPAEQPETGGMCDSGAIGTAAPEGCAYDDINCTCPMWTNTWSCRKECPASQPTTGDDCSENQTTPCVFDDQACTCGTEDDTTWTWTCDEIAKDCPAEQPDGGTCDAQAIAEAAPDGCAYGDMSCNCWNNSWMCRQQCPASPPTAGDDCVENQASPCEYADDDQVCSCGRNNNKWSCETVATSCPDTQPENGDACLRSAIEEAGNCTYDNIECSCGWMNGFNCREMADTDESSGDDTSSDAEAETDTAE